MAKKNALGYITAYNNAIYGQHTYVSLNESKHYKCLNTIIYGTTGSGKTRYVLKPNLLQMNSNYICIDPSGEIAESCGETLRRFGYDVKIVDTKTLKEANTYNPLNYAKDETSVKILVEAFIANTSDPNNKSGSQDPYWDEAMKQLLCGYVALQTTGPEWDEEKRVWSMIPEVMGNKLYAPAFANIAEFVRMTNKKYNPRTSSIRPYHGAQTGNTDNSTANGSDIAMIFENIRILESEHQECHPDIIEKPYCLLEWENFKTAPDKTSNTIITTTGTRLDPFNIKGVKAYSSTDTISLNTFVERKTALFIVIDMQIPTYRFLASFLLSQMFNILYTDGEENGATQKVLCLPNGEYIRRFVKKDQGEYMDKKIEAIKNSKIVPHILETHQGTTKNKRGKSKKITYVDEYYDIIDADGELVSRRPNKHLAQQYIHDLKNVIITRTKKCELPISTRFFIDEFANIGEIPQFTGIISTCRKYRITCMVILQDLTQLKKMYEKDNETIDTNCPFKIFLGGSGNETNKFLTEKIGKRTIISSDLSDSANNSSMSYKAEERDLIQASELGRLDPKCSLILIDNEQPIMDEKFDYPKHRNYIYTYDYCKDIKCYDACMFERPILPETPEIVFDVSNGNDTSTTKSNGDSNYGSDIPIVKPLDVDAFEKELNILIEQYPEDFDDLTDEDMAAYSEASSFD